MSEDVSSTIRVGVTVILVAALVATVLNLMVISQSILAGGQNTLQSGVDQVALQEFENYNLKKVSGTVAKSTASLYEGRDIAILIRTQAIGGTTGTKAWNYGSLLKGSSADSANDTSPVYQITLASNVVKKAGETFYTAEYDMNSGLINVCNNKKGLTSAGDSEYILDSARFQAELIKNQVGVIIGIMFSQL